MWSWSALFVLLGSYCVGAIPTGFLIARRYGISDIRRYGSGNIGATNVARMLGPLFFPLVLLLDAGKACLNIWLLQYLHCSQELILMAGVVHLVSNGYSPFLNWSGGKGVASLFGLLVALNWYVALCAAAVWLCTFLLTRVAGVASMVAVTTLPILGFAFQPSHDVFLFCIFASVWVMMRHKSNMRAFFAPQSVSK
jgi:acyl phosphate:glycerol-3-phosphate acyltransferase